MCPLSSFSFAVQVLVSVSLSLGYRSSEAFVCSHLNYLVAEWLSQRQTDTSYTLQSFPYTLLSCSTLEEFYRCYIYACS